MYAQSYFQLANNPCFDTIILVWAAAAELPAWTEWTMSILLNPNLEQRIVAKVQSGRYRSPAEVIQQGLDLLDARDCTIQPPPAQDEGSIGEIFVRLGQQIPLEEWSKVPADLSKNLDHYLYGSPKVSE
jgi:Arc/MetJ-type ribon-helix-helix transcriptional regulator